MVDGDAVLRTIRRAVESPSVLEGGPSDGEGFSGAALLALLADVAAVVCDASNAYTEIGVYRGLTLSTVARHTPAPCVGIDDFSLFNADATNRRIAQERLDRGGCDHATLADMDFEVALRRWPDLGHTAESIGLLFIDGPHDYRSQLMALLLGRPHLRPGGVIVVDDANYAHVRQASYDFLAAFPDWALVVEVTTPGHPDVVTPAERAEARSGWWNGVHVLQHDPSGRLPRLEPPLADVRMYVESHDVFRHRFGPTTLEVLEGFGRAADVLPDRDAAAAALLTLLDEQVARTEGRAPSQNTETSGALAIRIAGEAAQSR